MGIDIGKEIDIYWEKLLELQFQASNNISHKPTKGELREDFVKYLVTKNYSKLQIKSGILYKEGCNWQSSQSDFLLLKDNAVVGTANLYLVNDCKMFMEIKSCVKAKN